MGSVAETTTAEAQLYERHSELVFRYCLRMLRSREEAEDAAQTTFVQALRSLRRGIVPTFEQAWLLTIAKNECLSRYRSSKRRRELEVVRDPRDLAEIASAPTNGDGRLLGLQDALTRLPEMQRRALLLREWKGHSYAEIAQELSLSQGAVEALLFRARRSLARELGEEQRRSRKHAFDLASILGALKSLLGGSAGIKAAAVGVAAVASVSVAVGRSHMAPGPAPAKPEVRNVSTPASGTPVLASDQVSHVTRSKGGPTLAPSQTASRQGVTRRAPISGTAPVGHTAPAAGAPAAPQAPAHPTSPQPSTPSIPATPATPQVPDAPALSTPPISTPPISTPPVTVEVQTPDVQVPKLPLLPEVPPIELPDVKVEVPKVEVPKIELPGLPKLP